MKKLTYPIRFIVFIALFVLDAAGARAQQPYRTPAGSTTAPVNTTTAARRIVDTLGGYNYYDSTEIRLVRLALEGPAYRASENQNQINEYVLKSARNTWENLLTLSLNYNDQSFKKQNPNSTYVYPKFFVGLNIPLGTLFSRIQVKAAREQIKISKANQEELARTIRTDVLAKYREYKTKKELLRLQTQVLDDEQASFLQVQKNYREGSVNLEAHNAAQKKYSDELGKKLNFQMDLDILKLDIEKMIGINLESVTN
jgi:outer membrane protein TolC